MRIVQFSVYKNYWSDFVEKKIRLLPNKMNKYSIRRFSVGTASILVGTTLLFGIGNEAHAAEGDQTPNANENVADKDVSGTQLKEEAQNNEVTNEEPSKEEAQNNEVTNEEPSKEEATSNEVTSEEQPKEEATSNEVTNEESSKEEATSNEVTSEEQPKEEATSNEVTSEEPSKEEAASNEVTNEEPSKEEATSKEVTSEEQPKEEAASKEVTNEESSKEEATSNEVTNEEPSKEEATSNEVTSEEQPKEEVTSNEATNEEPSKEEVTSNEATNEEPSKEEPSKEEPSKEEVTSNEVTNEGPSSDEASANDSTSNPDFNSKVLNDSVQEFDNDQSSDSEDRNVAYATPNGTTATRSVKPVSRVAVNRSQAQQQGKNVNDSIKVTSVNTDKDYVEPNNGQGFSADVSFEVDGKVHKGDYFTVDMPEYADFNGIADYKAANNKIYPTINDGNQVVANGVYDTQTKN